MGKIILFPLGILVMSVARCLALLSSLLRDSRVATASRSLHSNERKRKTGVKKRWLTSTGVMRMRWTGTCETDVSRQSDFIVVLFRITISGSFTKADWLAWILRRDMLDSRIVRAARGDRQAVAAGQHPALAQSGQAVVGPAYSNQSSPAALASGVCLPDAGVQPSWVRGGLRGLSQPQQPAFSPARPAFPHAVPRPLPAVAQVGLTLQSHPHGAGIRPRHQPQSSQSAGLCAQQMQCTGDAAEARSTQGQGQQSGRAQQHDFEPRRPKQSFSQQLPSSAASQPDPHLQLKTGQQMRSGADESSLQPESCPTAPAQLPAVDRQQRQQLQQHRLPGSGLKEGVPLLHQTPQQVALKRVHARIAEFREIAPQLPPPPPSHTRYSTPFVVHGPFMCRTHLL